MDTDPEILIQIVTFQHLCFCLLFLVGSYSHTGYVFLENAKYRRYSFTHARLAELKTTLVNGCSNLTNLPCSLQMNINSYFFWSKFLIIYYLSIIIAMTYTWHRTVRFSHCVITFFLLLYIIFRTDLILHFDGIVYVTFVMCFKSFCTFSFLEGLMPHNIRDPWRAFCETIASACGHDTCLLYGHSKCARFYQWTMRMKKQWNIKEEKLIITFIVEIITSISFATYLFGPKTYSSWKDLSF